MAEGLDYVATWNAGLPRVGRSHRGDGRFHGEAAGNSPGARPDRRRARHSAPAAPPLRRPCARSSSAARRPTSSGADGVDDVLGLVEQRRPPPAPGTSGIGSIAGSTSEPWVQPTSARRGGRRGSRPGTSRAPPAPGRGRRTGPPRPSRRSGTGSACTLPASAWRPPSSRCGTIVARRAPGTPHRLSRPSPPSGARSAGSTRRRTPSGASG